MNKALAIAMVLLAAPGQGSLFYSAPTQGYCLTSSTDGRKAFYEYGDSGFPPTGPCAPLGSAATGSGGLQDPLDFAASAVALTSTEYGYYKQFIGENGDPGILAAIQSTPLRHGLRG